ncbi:unannotated protein [freshwater metagenome]|uniref:Unannotated protein n=1 Tax=freshwater metagenome TaxID=449393 RepID=A0A6J7MYV3_9ZZZZ
MGVAVLVRVVPDHDASVLEVPDDLGVRLEDMLADPRHDLCGVTTLTVHRADRRDAHRVTDILVVLTEAGREVHNTRAVLGRHELGCENLERVRRVGEEREQGCVPAPGQFGAEHRADPGGAHKLALVGTEACVGEEVALAILFHHGVLDVGAHGEREIGRKGPRCRGPCQNSVAIVEGEGHRQRRVLAIPVDVVHPSLGIRQGGLAAPAVGEYAEALVHETLVPQSLERPHDALHVRKVERLVVVVEVHPAGLARDVTLPLARVAQHARSTGLVETGDAVLDDLRVTADAEFLLRLHLGGQAVAVPAEATLDPLSAHRAVPRDRVLHEPREQVAVVR